MYQCKLNELYPFIFLAKHIQMDKDRVIEGEIRSKQLNTYLEKMNCPKKIFMSEDASGVIQKVIYDVHSNQLVGLVLPINSTSGIPKMFNFEANTSEDIETYLKLPKSTLVYIMVAQPLIRGVAPFILQVFGTDNKFKTSDVLNRWKYTINELDK